MKLTPTGQSAQEDSVIVPWHQFPVFKANKAVEKGTSKNLLFRTWGGIGDVICSIPTIMYAKKYFTDCRITVATYFPELFEGLGIDDIYDVKKERPIFDDYLCLDTIPDQGQGSLASQFLTHMHINCLDFPALSALRCQLPISEREVRLEVPNPKNAALHNIASQFEKYVVVHAGRHWQSKTFSAEFWNAVLDSIKLSGFTPVLIGKDGGPSQGYVQTRKDKCIDLRDKTTLQETIWLLQNTAVLVCNDSSPLHMACTGKSFIGFIASVKHPDFITHYRRGIFGWRMKDFSRDGLWNHSSVCPNIAHDLNLDECDPKLIESFLPDPNVFGKWCEEKMDEYRREV